VVSEGIVFFGSGDGRLYAVDSSRGREVWRFKTGGPVDSTPAVAGDRVFFAGGDRFVYAVDRRTGREVWRFALGEDLPFSGGFDYHESSPAVEGDAVFVGGGDGSISCLAASTGRVLWRYQTGGRVRASPVISGGTVFIGSFDGVFYALDARSGRLHWKYATEGASLDLAKWGFDRRSINSSAAVAGGLVTFGSRDAHQYALEAKTGALRWRFAHPVAFDPNHAELAWCEGSPAISDGVTYVGSSDGHFVNAIELATGRELWRHATPSRILSSPAVAGGMLFVGGEEGSVVALDRRDGGLVWSFLTNEMVYSSPALASGMLYVGADDGALYAFGEATESASFLPWKAVYFDEKLSGWFKGGKLLADYLRGAGYQLLDAATLPGFLADRVEDRLSSVVVFASDQPPASVTRSEEGPTLVESFLRSGGRIVWVGMSPFSLKFDEETGKRTGLEPAMTRKILGVGPDSLGVTSIEDVASFSTREGGAWGLPPFWIASMPVDPAEVTVTLAKDPNGLANAWIKVIGSGRFIRLWGRQQPILDLKTVKRVAEHDL
jgi:outer membrane protein assembly factor BamB